MMTRLRSRHAVLAVLLFATSLFLPARADTVGALDVELLDIEPAVLVEGSELTVRARVTNRTETRVADATVELRAQEWTPTTRTALARWLEEDVYTATLPLLTVELPSLEPGATHTATLAVDAADFGFTTWGPRGIEVSASAPAESVSPDRERAWVIWWDDPGVTPIGIGFLSPITPTVAELTDPASASGRTTALLAQATLPGVTPMLDPALDVPAARELAQAWLLPWGNADAAALVAAGRSDLLTALRGDPGGMNTLDWLPELDQATLAGTDGDVVVAADIPPAQPRSYTPHGVGELAGRTVVVTDTGLSDALRGTVTGTRHALNPVQQRQFVAATAAVVVRERPSSARTVFAALPADDDASRASLITLVSTLPFVVPTTLAEAVAGPERTELNSTLPAEADLPPAAVSADELRRATEATAELDVLREVVAEPETVIDPLLRQLSTVPSLAWRAAPQARAALLNEITQVGRTYTTGLEIRGASTVNMVSESANFPVTVVSTLPVDATVALDLVPSARGLEQAAPVTVTVPAGGEVAATVPVSGVGWGDITVTVHLRTPSGAYVGDAVEIPVRVRAEWENIAVIGLVAFASFGLVLGTIRTVRRNRRTVRDGDAAAQHPAQDPSDTATEKDT